MDRRPGRPALPAGRHVEASPSLGVATFVVDACFAGARAAPAGVHVRSAPANGVMPECRLAWSFAKDAAFFISSASDLALRLGSSGTGWSSLYAMSHWSSG